MNQIKIGKFIAECRRDKNLTQEQLAEMLKAFDKIPKDFARFVYKY